MGSVVSSIFGGGAKAPSGPSAAELEAQRKADEAAQEEKDARARQQGRENTARRRAALNRAGVVSTIATGSSGLTDAAATTSSGYKTKLGQ
jgi:phage protein D